MKKLAVVSALVAVLLVIGSAQPDDQSVKNLDATGGNAAVLPSASGSAGGEAEIVRLAAELGKVRGEVTELRKEMGTVRQELNKASKRLDAIEAKGKRKADTTVYDIEIGASPVLGPENAPVTIVEFVDFQCPFCAKEWPTIKKILAKYPNDVKLVFKHFPLGFHKQAPPVHAAAQLAKGQKGSEAFWKMHDLIMAQPKKLDIATLRGYADSLDMDLAAFDAVMADNNRINELLAADRQAARKCNVRGTPAVYINGLALSPRGVKNYEKRIEQILGQKKQ